MDNNQVRICVPVCERSVRHLEDAISSAAAAGDFVEIRFDCLEPSELAQSFKQTEEMMRILKPPLIITFRPAEQGGERTLDRESTEASTRIV